MKKKPSRYIWVAIGLFVALGVVLFFFSPWAPLILLLSLAIQIPIVYAITRYTMNSSYGDRAYERRQQYLEDDDAAAWLAAEEREAASVGQRYWSQKSKQQSLLNRAEPLVALGRRDEAAELLAEVDEKKLDSYAEKRYTEIVQALRGETAGDEPAESENPEKSDDFLTDI